jgi:DNA-binding MarR family transcriptional regulator
MRGGCYAHPFRHRGSEARLPKSRVVDYISCYDMTAPKPRAAARVDYRALANFRHEIRRFLRTSEEAARREGLEPQHHQLLLALKGLPAGQEPTVSALSERLQINHNSTVGLIDRLVRRRLVTRRRDPADQRRVLIRLTAPGQAVLHRLSLFHQDELRSQAPVLVSALVAIIRATRARA